MIGNRSPLSPERNDAAYATRPLPRNFILLPVDFMSFEADASHKFAPAVSLRLDQRSVTPRG